MKGLLTLMLLLLGLTALGQLYDQRYGKPLIVFQTYGTWSPLGSDIPSFAFYENGQIIYAKWVNGQVSLFSVILKKEDIKQTIKSLGFTDNLQRLPKFINAAPYTTDQFTYKLILDFDSLKEITVYGYLGDKKDRKRTPQSFLRVYDHIYKFKERKANKWLPDSVQVILLPEKKSNEKYERWPDGWPDLKNSRLLGKGSDIKCIYVDKTKMEKILILTKSGLPMEINGQQFYIFYRLPFPNIE
jgi:hypothetical protein